MIQNYPNYTGGGLAPTRAPQPSTATPCHYISHGLASVLPAPRHRPVWGSIPQKCSGTGLGEGWMGPCGCQAWDHPKTVGERAPSSSLTPTDKGAILRSVNASGVAPTFLPLILNVTEHYHITLPQSKYLIPPRPPRL